MSDIVLSGAVRANLSALQSVTGLIEAAQKRLATGKRINSPLDDPTRYFAANALSTRASALNSLLDSVSSAYQAVETANAGITALTDLVENAQSIVTQAQQNTGTTATYTGTVAGLTLASSFTVDTGDTFTINDGTVTATATAAGGVLTVQQIVDAVNNHATLKVKASLTSDGRLLFQATGTNTIVRGGSTSSGEKLQFGLSSGTTAAGTLNTTRTGLATQFDQIRIQIDQMASDSSYKGVNLLTGGNLSVVFNESGTSSFTITGVTVDSNGLGVAAATNAFQTEKDINDALADMTAALSTLKAQATSFSANLSVIKIRQDFMNGLIETLNAGADDLVLADINEEGANLLVLQSRQDLLTTVLSLAAQSSNNILSRF
jgi:flagellin-like hook-associated protein FlgL